MARAARRAASSRHPSCTPYCSKKFVIQSAPQMDRWWWIQSAPQLHTLFSGSFAMHPARQMNRWWMCLTQMQEHLVSSTKTARCSSGTPFHLDTGRPSYACPSFLNF